MKHFNRNAILFFLSVAFLLLGLWGECLPGFWDMGKLYLMSIVQGQPKDFDDFRQEIDNASTKTLFYHDSLLDLHSGKEALLGTRVVEKDDTIVLKTESGTLSSYRSQIPQDTINKLAEEVGKLYTFAQEQGAHFLYMSVPNKEYYQNFPANYINYAPEDYDSFVGALRERQIPCYDFADTVRKQGLNGTELYFYTDHHWTPRTAFLANGELCRELGQKYGFSYNEAYLDLQSYEIITYRDHSLGSYGKKVGRYFTRPYGEDFDLILPRFETEFTSTQLPSGKSQHGDFSNSLLYKQHMKKDYYGKSTYTTYLGGNRPLHIIENHLNPQGKTFVIFKDSFAATLVPFLAQQAGQIHLLDIRDSVVTEDERIDVAQYLRDVDPDYILVLYNAPSKADYKNIKYQFFY